MGHNRENVLQIERHGMTPESMRSVVSTTEVELDPHELLVLRREEVSLKLGALSRERAQVSSEYDEAILERIGLFELQAQTDTAIETSDELLSLRIEKVTRKLAALSMQLTIVTTAYVETITETTSVNELLAAAPVDRQALAHYLQTPETESPLFSGEHAQEEVYEDTTALAEPQPLRDLVRL